MRRNGYMCKISSGYHSGFYTRYLPLGGCQDVYAIQIGYFPRLVHEPLFCRLIMLISRPGRRIA
ncbi:MAG: hypothetical protein METHP_00870 [Methanoregula sp. SKADARSKE-2]|nr:MAG: hypothetical protein METHP_00870 [Methanoregula sp. SKADARSKE-2]